VLADSGGDNGVVIPLSDVGRERERERERERSVPEKSDRDDDGVVFREILHASQGKKYVNESSGKRRG
jgi:hypothetical protein